MKGPPVLRRICTPFLFTLIIATGQSMLCAQSSRSPTDIGIFRSGSWSLDSNGNGVWDGTPIDQGSSFGQANDVPIAGDWNGTGTKKIAVFRNGVWLLDINGNGQYDTGIDPTCYFGQAGDVPVVGDWTGDGRTKIGIFRNGLWILDTNGNC